MLIKPQIPSQFFCLYLVAFMTHFRNEIDRVGSSLGERFHRPLYNAVRSLACVRWCPYAQIPRLDPARDGEGWNIAWHCLTPKWIAFLLQKGVVLKGIFCMLWLYFIHWTSLSKFYFPSMQSKKFFSSHKTLSKHVLSSWRRRPTLTLYIRDSWL